MMDSSMQQTMLLELEREPLMSPAAYDQNKINAKEWEKYRVDFY